MITFEEPEYVFLTAFRTPQFIAYLKSLGIYKCFEKPIDIDTLLQVFRECY